MRSVRLVVSGTLLVVNTFVVLANQPRPSQQQSAPVDLLLQRSAHYLDHYQSTLATVTAEEAYSFDGPGGIGQDLTSDVLLVGIRGSWVEFRDVFRVNNRPIRDHAARLEALLGDSTTLLARAQRIADESASYNQGLQRNINVPTMALTYLMKINQPRSSFRVVGTADKGVAIVEFQETAQPPLIHSSVGSTQTSGRFWIDSDTGAVSKSELVLKIPEGAGVRRDSAVSGTITVAYERDAALGFLVPHVMEEHYDKPTQLVCRATYSQYKSFGVIVKSSAGGGR